MKKKIIISFIAFIVSVLLVVVALPHEYQMKIWRKLIIPYQYIYVHDLEEIIEPRRADMSVFYNNKVMHGKEAYIAHGGGVGYYCKKECQDGIEDALSKGFKFIEIDFLESVDGHLFGGYSWELFAKLVGKSVSEVKEMPMSEIKKLKLNGKHSVLTAEDILTLLNKHKDWYLVTDHTRNFELLMKEIPMPDRMLVETIGGPYDYKIAIEAGVRYPMHTLSDIDCAEKYEFPIMVVNAKFFLDSSNLERLERLHRKGVTFLVWNSTISD